MTATFTDTRPSTGDVARWLSATARVPVTRSSRHVPAGLLIADWYVDTYWTPSLGTLAVAILRRLDRFAAASAAVMARGGEPFTVSIAELALDLGARGSGSSAKVPRAIARLAYIHLIDIEDGGLAVPARVRRLTPNQAAYGLPEHLRASHRMWEGGR